LLWPVDLGSIARSLDELRIPKRAVRVDLTRADGTRLEAEVYLSEFASAHVGGERLSEMLNSGPFLPARDLAQGKVSFLSCHSIAVARVAREVEADDDAAAHTIPTEHEVVVTLLGGQTLSGLLTYVLPPERSRLIDYLNGCPLFIPLLEADHLALINREHIARVDPVSR
jgi:hypothetical protein